MVNKFKNTMDEKQRDFDAEILTSFDLPADEIGNINFISRSGSVNWNAVVTVDIEKIIKEKNFVSLKENVLNVINYDLESTPSALLLDPGFVKLFRVAQLTIEYLLHVQQYLRSLVSRSNNDKKWMQEIDNRRKGHGLIASLGEYNSTANNYNVRKGHRLIILENEFENVYQCSICGKVFLDEHYLAAHHQRRHSGLQQLTMPEVHRLKSNVAANLSESLPSKLQEETEKIWKELEMLRKKVVECESCNLKKKDAPNESKNLNDGGRNEPSLIRNQEVLKLIEEEHDSDDLKTIEEEKMKKENDASKSKEDGRLEAQERVWRGRLKALSDEREKEIESLKKLISSFQQKEERYEQRIEKLTSELREKSMREMEKQEAQDKEEKAIASESISENVEFDSSDASEDTAPSSQPDAEVPTKLNSTFTYGADEVKSSDSEVESSENLSSNSQRTLDDDVVDDGEKQEMNSRELSVEMFNRKLKHLGISPKAKKISQAVFKERMDVLKRQQKDLAKNIEGYHQIKSNIEEKSLAKVSQRLQGPHVKHSRSLAELPSHNLDNFRPKRVKKRNFDTFEFSPKNTSTPSTSRLSSSSHASTLKQKGFLKKSPVIVNSSRSWPSVLGTKNSKGMVTVTSHSHPKKQEKALVHSSQGIHISSTQGKQRSSSGGILRGVTIEASDGSGDKRVSTLQSLGNVAGKSVSFSLAHNLVLEKPQMPP